MQKNGAYNSQMGVHPQPCKTFAVQVDRCPSIREGCFWAEGSNYRWLCLRSIPFIEQPISFGIKQNKNTFRVQGSTFQTGMGERRCEVCGRRRVGSVQWAPWGHLDAFFGFLFEGLPGSAGEKGGNLTEFVSKQRDKRKQRNDSGESHFKPRIKERGKRGYLRGEWFTWQGKRCEVIGMSRTKSALLGPNGHIDKKRISMRKQILECSPPPPTYGPKEIHRIRVSSEKGSLVI